MTQTSTERSFPDNQRCSQCDAALPPHATFCGSCGARVPKEKSPVPASQDDSDPTNRYRITSLVRRRPYISLYFAIDNQQQQTVAISEIDISSLNDKARARATELVKREYDLLRRQHIPNIMPILDVEYRQERLFVVAGNPSPANSTNNNEANEETEHTEASGRLSTLDGLLQSGIGLPEEQTALQWAEQLCLAVDKLHNHQVVIGGLDPETIVVEGEAYEGQPALMLSWLPLYVRTQLPQTSTPPRAGKMDHFSAPEALLGRSEPRSDVYSLGAILYLLLTGVPPADPAQREERHMRSPRELNARISPELDEIVMRALAFERSERFQSAESMAEALANPYLSTKVVRLPKRSRTSQENVIDQAAHAGITIDMIDTIPVTPPSQTDLARWRAAMAQARAVPDSEPAVDAIPTQTFSAPPKPRHRTPVPEELSPERVSEDEEEEGNAAALARRLRKRITGILPAIQHATQPKANSRALIVSPQAEPVVEDERSLLKQLQRFVLGEQQHSLAAAAIIEAPLRIQPGQGFSMRIRLLGRNAVETPIGMKKGSRPGGISGLVHGDYINIEVRSAFYQKYAFIIQRAAITMPGQGYAADVTIPMPPPSSGRNGRRERLHIVFMDEQRRVLYERPFVLELFISPLVRPGREGHQSVPIPF